jgi:hypothetical protein
MAMFGNEDIVQHQRLAAGAKKPEHLPIVDDLGFREQHQQIGDVAWVALRPKKGAEDRPLRIVAAA